MAEKNTYSQPWLIYLDSKKLGIRLIVYQKETTNMDKEKLQQNYMIVNTKLLQHGHNTGTTLIRLQANLILILMYYPRFYSHLAFFPFTI